MGNRHLTYVAAAWGLVLLSVVAAQDARPTPGGQQGGGGNAGGPAGGPVGMGNAQARVSSADVEAAIARGKAYLYSRQKDGNWEESARKQPVQNMGGPMGNRGENPVTSSQWGGLSSIATFALLASGEPSRDERMIKALAFLKSADVTGTYALGLHAQVWNLINPVQLQKEYRPMVPRDGGILLKGLKSAGDARGTYHYTPDDGGWDNSTAQFGVLGMWACVQAGYEVPNKYWQEVEDAWIRHQDKSGGWTYGGGMGGGGMGGGAMVMDGPPGRPGQPGQGRPPGPGGGGPPNGPPGRGGPPGGGMQPGMQPGMPPGGGGGGGGGMGGPPDAGKVTLSMTAAGVATLFITQDYLHGNFGVACKGNYSNAPLDAGLKWIGEHYDEINTDRHYYYTEFGISRIGLASGRKYFGTKDWYREGAARLLQAQRADGSWNDSISDTAFAMLFLARGRAPIVMNKLEYAIAGKDGKVATANWNQRPRDVANGTRWLSRQMERDLNWQTVNLQVAVDDLHDAPILYLAGNQTLSFTPAEEAKLRDFVEQGGLILGNADCGNKLFADSFVALGHRLFSPYEFRDLPPNHIIFTSELVKMKVPVGVKGISNGCRELMLLVPAGDPARAWQTQSTKPKEELFQLLGNIFLYAVDKKALRYKEESHVIKPNLAIAPRSTTPLARIQYVGNWNPEPGGWRQVSAIMHNQLATDLAVQAVQLGEGKLSAFKLAHLTGTTKFTFTEAQRAELKQFVQKGGTLIVDAAGGSGEFANAIEAELVLIFGDPAKNLRAPISPDHPMYTAGGAKPAAVTYRLFARNTVVGALKTPRVGVVQVDGRVGVIYSPDDLSVGLVGQSMDGIIGYEPESATRLMLQFIQFAGGKQ